MPLTALESHIDIWWLRDAPPPDAHSARGTSSAEVLAEVLARYVEGKVTLRRDDLGKPRLAPGIDDSLEFNLSHSGAWRVVAVTRAAPVGVDLERSRTFSDLERFIDRACTLEEAARLRQLPALERAPHLLRLWTVKEAYAKATGRGIRSKVSEIVTGPCDDGWTVGCAWLSQDAWHAQPLPAPDGLVATVCCAAQGRLLRQRA